MSSKLKKQFLYKIFLELIVLLALLLGVRLLIKNYALVSIAIVVVFWAWHYFMSIKLMYAITKREKFYGKTLGIWQIIRDEYNYRLLKNKKTSSELLHILANSKKALNKIEQGVLINSLNHDIIWSNKSANKIFQFEYHTKNKYNFLHISHNLEIRSFVNQLVNGDKKKLCFVLQSGQNFYKVNGYKVDNIYLLLVENITSEQINKLRQRNLTSYINHDLRTPMTVLSGYLEMLEDNKDILSEVIEPMQYQISKMQHLLNELTQLADLENISVNKQVWCNFSEQVQNIIADVQKLYPTYPLTIDILDNVYIKGDKLNLNRLATNLIYNAIKHNPEHTSIAIKLEKYKKGIRFEVRDQGIGIDKEHIPYLTLRFYKADKARNTDTKQSGLGLSIVKHILESYKSKLEIQSTKFQGSIFSFYLKKSYVQFENPAKIDTTLTNS